jgi:predicted nucleic acid-binding protein
VGAIVLDSSVVIGLFEPRDAHHESASTAIIDAREAGHQFILPASVLSEVMVGAYRDGVAATKHRVIIGLFGPAHAPGDEVALAAAELRSRHLSLRLPDALVIATGIVADAAVLTCDKRLASVDGRVQVIEAD